MRDQEDLSFWLQLGVTGFRMDAGPFIIERTEPGRPDAELDFDFTELRQHLQWQRGDAVLLAEANVEPEQLKQYFGDAGGPPTGCTCCSTSCSTAA